jgi:DNA-binding PucR family transcriptional regulator
VALTVRQLCDIPHLRTRIHAGDRGGERVITWAHSIEMARPWEWLEEGNLLMTVGLGIPAGAEAQVEYVESLARAGLSGIAIGENMQAPPLTDEMLKAADRHELPLLITAYEVPFIQLSRVVGAADQQREHRRLVDAARVYDRVRAHMVQGGEPEELIEGLGEELECRLWVCANESGLPVFTATDPPPPAVRDAFAAAVRERGGTLPGVLRLDADPGTVVVPVPSRRAVSMLATPLPGSKVPAYAVLQHAATVAALEVERRWAGIEEQRRLGAEILAALIDGRLSPLLAARQAGAHGLGQGPFVLLALAREGGWSGSGWLHHTLAERNIGNLLLRREETVLCLLPGEDAAIETVAGLFDESVRGGVSDVFAELDGVQAATRVVRYGQAQPSRLGARSLDEARTLVDRVLGPVLDYDAEHGTELVASLSAFLACNRSWQRASAQLFVHKQTLVYRMQRVESLTGLALNDTAAVVELWLALQALQMVSG